MTVVAVYLSVGTDNGAEVLSVAVVVRLVAVAVMVSCTSRMDHNDPANHRPHDGSLVNMVADLVPANEGGNEG